MNSSIYNENVVNLNNENKGVFFYNP